MISVGGYRAGRKKQTLKCGAGLEKFIVKRSLEVWVFFHSYSAYSQTNRPRAKGKPECNILE